MKSVIDYSPAHRVGLKPQVITQTVDQHGRRLIPLQWSTLVNACLTYDEFSSIFSRLADRTIRYLTQFHSGIHSSGTRPTREVFAEKAREAQRGLERLRWVQPLSEAAALAHVCGAASRFPSFASCFGSVSPEVTRPSAQPVQ